MILPCSSFKKELSLQKRFADWRGRGECGGGGDLIEDAAELLLEVVEVLEPVGEEDVVDLLVVVVAANVVGDRLLLGVVGAGVVRIVVLLDGTREREREIESDFELEMGVDLELWKKPRVSSENPDRGCVRIVCACR